MRRFFVFVRMRAVGKWRPQPTAAHAAGYDCSFVGPLPEDLQSECSICLHVLREPILVRCCGCVY